ncbi:MAG: hypothetical protein DWQ45_10080 [Planctomycetota bacterium]|nr:MAG: hypothetical protein DWQ41_18875 [Planctomycetota bacterium]REK36026.1 MAG: hypothetical protein DWQ45_10080 [Planctomycetota bacterium]
MNSDQYHRGLHRFACATPIVALVTVIAGALVTSKRAGMAFRDWPSSDGHFMLTYPWLRDFATNWDKFLEHGHRLAGATIGLWVILLLCWLLKSESRRWVKWAGGLVLLSVVAQGLLGGMRVRLDAQTLAMLHGGLAACVLSLMAVLATVLSRNWLQAKDRFADVDVGLAKPMAALIVCLLAMQFLLGGLIRHMGTGLHEHLVMGIASLVLIVANAFLTRGSASNWIARSGWLLLSVALLQVALGAGAWVVKYGFAATGFVATADSIGQVAFRTAHTVVGILLFMTAVVHAVRVLRVDAVSEYVQGPILSQAAAPGGVA